MAQTDARPVYLGETYSVTATWADANGDPLTIDGTWSSTMRVVKGTITGEPITDVDPVIVGGKYFYSFDTTDQPTLTSDQWEVGIYWYGIRITVPGDDARWICPTKLEIEEGIAPES